MMDNPDDLGISYENAQDQLARNASSERRYDQVFSHFHASALSRAIRWFREEGIVFSRPPQQLDVTEFIVGLGIAAKRACHELGDAASEKVEIAALMLDAAAEMRLALDRPLLETETEEERKAEQITIAIALGQIDMVMRSVEAGHFEAFERLQADRLAKQEGARKANARKASNREEALAVAMELAPKNTKLSHEGLVLKIRERISLPYTVKTMTDWVRDWRKSGVIAAQTNSGR